MTTKAIPVDILPPITIKIIPADNANSVASNSNFSITFSEKIKVGTGNITLISDNGNDSRTISITDKQVKISGNKLILNPTFDLNVGSTYTVHFDAGTIKDFAPVPNFADAIDFTFATKNTGDKQAPILQNNVGHGTISDGLQLTFQENVKIGKGNFTLSDGTNKTVISVNDPQVSIQNNVLTIHPTNLNPEKTYTLIAPKGIITDLAGNKFVGLTTKTLFKFDTHDITAPTIIITNDKITTTNSAITYTFTLNEASTNFSSDDITISGGTKGIFTALSSTIYNLVVTPAANSMAPVIVDVATGKFTDAAGNNNIAAVQNSQAIDTISPSITLSSNINNVATDGTAIISATFSETPLGFTINDFVSQNGSFSNFSTIDSTHYSVIFTPNTTALSTVDSNITVAAGSYTDAMGNLGAAGIKPVLTITPAEYTTSTNANGTTETYIFNQDGHQIVSVYNYDVTNNLISSIEKDTWTGHTSQTNYSLTKNADGTKTELYTFNNDGTVTSTQYEEVTKTKSNTTPFNASVTDVNFTIVENSSYTFNIANWGIGDSLLFLNDAITPTISNTSTMDNVVDVIYSDGNIITTIHLTGISQDASITNYDTFLQAFSL